MPIKPSPAVLRAAEILDFLAREPAQPQSLSEIARRTAISKATCHALLLGLVDAGLVARHDASRRYGLGPLLISLGQAAAAGHEIAQLALPEMERLSETLLLPVLGAVQAGSRLVVVAATALPRPFAVSLPSGQAVPFVPPLGAAYVAWSSADDVEAWLARAAEPVDARERRQFLDALELIRSLGFGVTIESSVREELGDTVAALAEHPNADDVRARRDELIRRLAHADYLPTQLDPHVTYRVTQMSAPVFDHDGEVAMLLAVTTIGLGLGLPGILTYGRAVRAAADRITRAIGGAPLPPPECPMPVIEPEPG
jgi:DNA-binding IclR family transcriptional regulator